MRALVIVHEPGCEPVLIGDRLRHHGFALDEVTVASGDGDGHGSVAFDAADEYDLVVPMGSIYSVYDTDTIGSWIGDELDFLRRADACDVPILGICFGAQALATALGGRAVRADRPQVGWFPVTPATDCGLPDGPWMQWHYDRFEPPADADVLAEDDVCVQAFTTGRHLGVQFHPEVTPAHVAGWIEQGGGQELAALGIDPAALLAETEAIESDVRTRTDRLVDWFLADIAKL